MVIIIFDIPLHNVTQKVHYIFFFFLKLFLLSVSTYTIIKHNSFECLSGRGKGVGVYSRPGAHELFLRLGWAVIRAGHLFE